uniref:Hexosyltransferase n=1 Tax=Sinocyclocheilus grahami TaxID=75366 RepID=A0A672M1L1_SINGR
MRIAMLVSLIRPTGPIIVGISLGFTLSLLSVTWVDESCDSDWMGAADEMLIGQPGSSKGARKPSSISTGTTENGNVEEDFEPRIVPYNKPAQEGPPKKVFRAKYASTELGIHERLFVSVFTSKTTISTLAVAINRTLNHHLDGRLIFFTGTRNRKLPNGMFVVAHGDERPVPNMFQSVRYLLEHHIADYDWFFFVQDDTYTQPERLKTLVSHLSMDLQLYMGHPGEFIGGETQGRYCHSGPGFLLSHTENWINEFMYRLHKHFTEIELQKTYEEIEKLQSEIKNVSKVAVDGNKSALWPIGITPPFEPKSRFEVLRWDYFTEDSFFSCVDGAPKCQLNGADRDDVTDVIKVAVEELNKKYNPFVQLSAPRLVNGYRRLDHTRGMEYTLDLQFQATTESGHQKSITLRVHLVRPLSQVEIIPMPYVTEATRVHVLLPLTSYDSHAALRFLDHCSSNLFETGENAVLNFLFTYEPAEAQKVSTNDVFSEVKAKITSIEHRYPSVKVSWISIKTESPGLLRILDIVSRKHPVETLFLLVTVDTMLNSEFLNRCRMNAISGWQAFFPIHFQEYDPGVAYPDQVPPASPDLVREVGHFDRYTFEEGCFYNYDYMSSRTRMSGDLQENEELLESLDLYDVFVQYSGLHVFRAVEPALRQAYRNRTCDPRLSEDVFHRCLQSNLESQGSRSQLAMLIFEQEPGNNT